MKRTAFILLGLLAAFAGSRAQTTGDATERALAAAPHAMREGATIIKWKPDNTYETVRKGTNRLVCFDRSGAPGQAAFSVQCTSIANLERVAQNRKFEAVADKAERQKMIAAAEANGTRVKPEYGSMWYDMSGADEAHAHLHATIAVPGATTKTTGLPENAKQGGVWIMDPGTTGAHIMMPGS
jgi:hypothetical protein